MPTDGGVRNDGEQDIPILFVDQVRGTDAIKVSWQAKGSRIVVLRKKMGNKGTLFQYPVNHADGVVVSDSKSTTSSVVDKAVKGGERYYYMAFAYDARSGWSIANPKAGDTTVSYDANPNIAQDMFVRTNLFGNTNIYGPAHWLNDGDRGRAHQQTTAASQVVVDIDLKRPRKIKEVVFWQTSDRYMLMRYITIYVSNDGRGWRRVTGEETASITSPGGLGKQIVFGGVGHRYRWLRAVVRGNAAYYRGIGEIEIYEQQVTYSPDRLVAVAQNNDNTVKLTWKPLPKGTTVMIRRQKLQGIASLYNYPSDHTKGTLIHTSDQSTFYFHDKTVVPGKRWYYAAFTFSKSTGWSHIEWSGLDNAIVGVTNPNMAVDKRVSGGNTFNHNSVYGHGHFLVDGRRKEGMATTDWKYLHSTKTSDNGNLYELHAEIDLKRIMTVAEIAIFQTGDRHFAMNYVRFYFRANANQVWRSMGEWKIQTAANGGMGGTWNFGNRVRYIKVMVRTPCAYYVGLGEVEVYEAVHHKRPENVLASQPQIMNQ